MSLTNSVQDPDATRNPGLFSRIIGPISYFTMGRAVGLYDEPMHFAYFLEIADYLPRPISIAVFVPPIGCETCIPSYKEFDDGASLDSMDGFVQKSIPPRLLMRTPFDDCKFKGVARTSRYDNTLEIKAELLKDSQYHNIGVIFRNQK